MEEPLMLQGPVGATLEKPRSAQQRCVEHSLLAFPLSRNFNSTATDLHAIGFKAAEKCLADIFRV